MPDSKYDFSKEELNIGETSPDKPADFSDPDDLFDLLIEKIRKYHPSDDTTMISKAYEVARNAHAGQLRKSGEPYIIHPLCVAIILADLELDKESIVAGHSP